MSNLYGFSKFGKCRLEGLHRDRVGAVDITVTLVNNSSDPVNLAVIQY